jgi:aryl-alcohol dehydrogenase-like predicted oxidoreductase
MKIGSRDVGAIGLGTAQLAFKDVSMSQAVATIRAGVAAGIHLIDTALAYTRPGVQSLAEEAVAEAMASIANRARILVATKGGHRRAGDRFPIDASPAALRADCELSLQALKVDSIDLYQLHHVDPDVPLVESVGALRDLQEEGKIDMIGLSNVDIEQIEQARSVATIVSVQNRFGIDYLEDLPTTQYCLRLGIAYLAYMPLGGSDRARSPGHGVRVVAQRHHVSIQQVQIAWLLARHQNVLPLVGASRPQTIEDSAASVALQLDTDDLVLLKGVSDQGCD